MPYHPFAFAMPKHWSKWLLGSLRDKKLAVRSLLQPRYYSKFVFINFKLILAKRSLSSRLSNWRKIPNEHRYMELSYLEFSAILDSNHISLGVICFLQSVTIGDLKPPLSRAIFCAPGEFHWDSALPSLVPQWFFKRFTVSSWQESSRNLMAVSFDLFRHYTKMPRRLPFLANYSYIILGSIRGPPRKTWRSISPNRRIGPLHDPRSHGTK